MSGRLDRVSTAGFLHALGQKAPASAMVGVETFLAARAPAILSTEEIADWLYADDPEGGADTGLLVVSVIVCRLRKRGVPVVTHHGRGYSLPARTA